MYFHVHTYNLVFSFTVNRLRRWCFILLYSNLRCKITPYFLLLTRILFIYTRQSWSLIFETSHTLLFTLLLVIFLRFCHSPFIRVVEEFDSSPWITESCSVSWHKGLPFLFSRPMNMKTSIVTVFTLFYIRTVILKGYSNPLGEPA